MTKVTKHKALRYNTNKPKFSLLDQDFLKETAEVMTYGLEKYTLRDENGDIITTGKDNWREGLSWTETLDSLYRHLHAFQKRDLIDNESLKHHLAHAAANIMFLHYYSYHRREFDDMPYTPFYDKRVGLDIDDVLCDFVGGWTKRYGDVPVNHHWSFDRKMNERFDIMKKEGTLDDFFLSLEAIQTPAELPFEPVCYITSRHMVDIPITEQWLHNHGFPSLPIIVSREKEKECIKQNLDIFVDDNFQNFRAITKAGVLCYLYDQPHNRKYNVGYKRIKSLKEVI